MTVIEDFQEGAHGIVKLTVTGGSLFRFRRLYMEQADEGGGLGELTELSVGAALDDTLLERAAEAQAAEDKAQSLLARAEQYRAGLERKLLTKKFSRVAIGMALDYLEQRGWLSDQRYAQTWIRQRMRRHPEGPLSVKAGLAAKGLSRDALALAIAAEFTEEQRPELLEHACGLLDGLNGDDMRRTLKKLGWKGSEIDELYERT